MQPLPLFGFVTGSLALLASAPAAAAAPRKGAAETAREALRERMRHDDIPALSIAAASRGRIFGYRF